MKYFKIIIAILTFSLFSCQGEKSDKVELVNATTFNEKINQPNVQLIDIRTPQEFNEQHIGDATNIDWNGADFEQKVANLDKSEPVYIYCKSGGRSAKAAAKLEEMGFTKIYELDGGIGSWNDANLAK